MIGQTIGSYQVTAKLGEGGMGEVYRAKDSTLKREVALKVLPAAVAADADRLARFQREAEVLASLNHPHIAQIYGFEKGPAEAGHHIGVLVMELVEGPTLADRIAQGAIPVDEAIPIAAQIAEALEAAHEQGVVHRDLKPANIKVRPDGTVKVLDFGLAKAMDPGAGNREPGAGNLAASPTITSPAMTAMGVILGTAAYMAPEQALGKVVDKRADIWAFGVVLWEMLSGRAMFQAGSVGETLAAVIRADINLSALPSSTPPSVRRLLERCLDRSTVTRLRDIGEARILLRSPQPQEPRAVDAPAKRPWGMVAAAALVTALLAGVVTWQTLTPAASPAPLRKFVLDGVTGRSDVAIAPDGARVAFFEDQAIWVRELSQLTPRKIVDVKVLDAFAEGLFWSADSQQVGYSTDRQLWRVPIAGGPAISIMRLPESGRVFNAAWGADNRILVSMWRGSLYEVPASGNGEPVIRLPLRDGIVDYHDVRVLPGGDILLFPHYLAEHEGESWIVSRTATTVLPRMVGARYAQGHLIYARDEPNLGVWAVPFDLANRRTTGDPFPVAPGAQRFSVSDFGLLEYRMFDVSEQQDELVWFDSAGVATAMPGSRVSVVALAPAPEGSRVAMSILEKGRYSLVVRDLGTGLDNPVVPAAEYRITSLTWSADGRRILFSQTEGFQTAIRSVMADGGAQPTTVTMGTAPAISPDGKTLLFGTDERGARRIKSVGFADGAIAGEPALLRRPEDDVDGAIVSPDGRLVAFIMWKDDAPHVYVSRLAGGTGQWPVTGTPGVPVQWASASELVYKEQQGRGASIVRLDQLKAVALRDAGDRVTASGSRPLFGAVRGANASQRVSTLARTGGRWLASRSVTPEAPRDPGRVVIVENWLAEFVARAK